MISVRHTNWHVITGAPCSGKTSVINALEYKGFRVVHEVARAYIDEEMQKGKGLEQIKADRYQFENHIFLTKLKIEASLPQNEIIFLDRAVPDSIAYFQFDGLNPGPPIEKSKLVRYKKIFLFERLAFLKDGVRSEDDLLAEKLDNLLETAYRMLKYDIVRVPAISVEERTAFILERLE
ncbi:MAG: ATP-binding protein [Deltaproteobacteria bacterium]|nr:ATP-binding protein [Deltaproteobacteria bacterium]